MCNLYSMTAAREAVGRLFRISHNRAASFVPLDAIFPGHMAPVVRRAGDGERELVSLSWGFVLPQQGKAPRRVTNVRDDKARSSGFWRDSFEQRRCLVPATAFCEPREIKPATWHWFALDGDHARGGRLPTGESPRASQSEQRPVFAFAGVWRRWRGPVKKDGPVVDLEVYAFMTTTPNALVSTINHERMPVLLDREEQFETWMSGTPDQAFEMVREYPPDAMRIVQAGMEKKDLLGAAAPPPKGSTGTLL